MLGRIKVNFEVDFGVNGAIGTVVTKWDLLFSDNGSLSSIIFFLNTHHTPLTLYDPGGGDFKSPPPLRFFALTHLILELHYCALVTFPKK